MVNGFEYKMSRNKISLVFVVVLHLLQFTYVKPQEWSSGTNKKPPPSDQPETIKDLQHFAKFHLNELMFNENAYNAIMSIWESTISLIQSKPMAGFVSAIMSHIYKSFTHKNTKKAITALLKEEKERITDPKEPAKCQRRLRKVHEYLGDKRRPEYIEKDVGALLRLINSNDVTTSLVSASDAVVDHLKQMHKPQKKIGHMFAIVKELLKGKVATLRMLSNL